MKDIYKCPRTGKTKVRTINNGPMKTDQSFVDKCNAHKIVENSLRTGRPITHLEKRQMAFHDVSLIGDLFQNQLKLQEAQKSFMQLHPTLRARFDNSIEKMVNFMNDPRNLEESVTLGLRTKTVPADKQDGNNRKGVSSTNYKKNQNSDYTNKGEASDSDSAANSDSVAEPKKNKK